MTYTVSDLYKKHWLDNYYVDVFGYNQKTGRVSYIVGNSYFTKTREAKLYYKAPNERDPWGRPYGPFFYFVTTTGEKHRLMVDCR